MSGKRLTPRLVAAQLAVAIALSTVPVAAQTGVTFVGLGDSIAQGVQSGDASAVSQPYSFVNLIAWRMGAALPLPLIRTNIFGAVGSTDGRSRYDAAVRSLNLAVSGADVSSILREAATAVDVSQIDTETELVLFPRTGSQIEVAEQLRPAYVACWIGNNDALGAALAYDALNGTQLTAVADFQARFSELVDRLAAVGAKAAFGTIPDVTAIGFLLNRQEMIRFLGSDHGVPEGSLVGLTSMFLVRLGLANGSIFANPDFVLDPAEQAAISTRIAQFNDVIRSTATARGMAVVETGAVFQFLGASGLNLFGVPLSTRFLGGLFSLDGVHPSNLGHGITAFFFIEALNQRYGANIPQLDAATLYWLTMTDPFIDKDRDGRVTGRFGAGLLETVFALLGITGDASDQPPAAGLAAGQAEALDLISARVGEDLRALSPARQAAVIERLFGWSGFRTRALTKQ